MNELFELLDILPQFMNRICFDFAPARTKNTLNRTHMRSIMFIGNNPNTTVTRLSETLSIDTGALSRVLSKLSSQDLISRTRDENDQRVVHLNLTPNGEDIYRELKYELHKHLTNRFSNFTKEQIDELMLALKIIEKSTSYIKIN